MANAASQIFANDSLQPAYRPDLALRTHVRLPVGTDFAPGTVLGFVSGAAQSEVKTVTISGTPTGGTFVLGFAGRATPPQAYNVSLANLRAALEAIVGAGNVAVTGTPGSSYVLTFQGQLASCRVGPVTAFAAFTGGTSPAIAAANTTRGSAGPGQADAYASGNADGTQVGRAVLECRVVANGTGGNDRAFPGSDAAKSFPAFSAVYAAAADLVGADATLVGQAGWRLARGTAVTDAGAVVALGL